METSRTPQQLESALRSLVKLMKAVRFYPPGHPTRTSAAKETLAQFSPLLDQQRALTFAIRKKSIAWGDQKVGAQNPVLQKLAYFLFARRIQHLTILPDLSEADLHSFVCTLILEPHHLQKVGGIGKVLQQAHLTTIWPNEVDLSRILILKDELEKKKQDDLAGEPEEKTEEGTGVGTPIVTATENATQESRDLARVLNELRRETSDQRFVLLLQELTPLVRLNLNTQGEALVLTAYSFLCETISLQQVPSQRKGACNEALASLITDDCLDYLIALLCSRSTPPEKREEVLGILTCQKGRVTHRLMAHLSEENDAQARKFLVDAMVRQNHTAIPVLFGYLSDSRWYVVRNAVSVLGEIRSQEIVPELTRLLAHKDIRVQREVIRALTRIGGQKSVGILLQTLEFGDPELRQQALLSLEAIKSPHAIPALLQLVSKRDPMVKQADLIRGAIRILGKTGTHQAIAPLEKLLNRHKILRRSRFAEVRAAAATALGEIGDPCAVTVLQKAANDRFPSVARAAAKSLQQIQKSQ